MAKLRTCQTVAVLIVLFSGIPTVLAQTKNQQKDPPAHFEGVVSAIDKSNPDAALLTIVVKEMRPTTREDEVTLIDKNYQFQVDSSTKVIGLDGKPDKNRLRSLPRGTKVRIETKPKLEKVAVEIKILPQN